MGDNLEFDDIDPFGFLKPSFHVSDDSPGLTCELKTYEARYNYRGERFPLQVGKSSDLEPKPHQDHNSALVLTRFYLRNRDLEKTELTIRSPFMKNALKEVIGEYPGVNFETESIILHNLPKCLFHYRSELQEFGLQLEPNSLEFSHILLLLQHMWQRLEAQCGSYINLMESPTVAPGLEFINLWMAFRPGDLLYTNLKGIHRIVKFKSMTRCECLEPRCQDSEWAINFEFIADDGSEMGYVDGELYIKPYDGYRPLERLNIFPLQYHHDKDAIKEELIARGTKMMSLRGVHYRMFEGESETLSRDRAWNILGEKDHFKLHSRSIKSRIMIDFKSFAKTNPNNVMIIDTAADPLPTVDGTDEYDLSDEHLLICDYEIPGFSLADKKWCWFAVDRVRDVEFNSDAFEKLLLPQGQKDMIYSLVKVHTNKNVSFDDVIKGKGKGMIFLLHGVPGVGKTLTAESVADITKRPLYTISCGELGISPAMVEENLQAALDLATSWNAIVLIDEADVFLEQRSTNDLERNSLVSIFLRLLEYYEGILFLTTNRIESFDAAFKSRIHLAIKYHALSPAYRMDLWKSFILNVAEQALFDWLSEEYLAELGKEDLNGRQIKNTVRTAYALAVSAGDNLSQVHIETALSAMRMFEKDFDENEVVPSNSKGDEPGAKRRRLGLKWTNNSL